MAEIFADSSHLSEVIPLISSSVDINVIVFGFSTQPRQAVGGGEDKLEFCSTPPGCVYEGSRAQMTFTECNCR